MSYGYKILGHEIPDTHMTAEQALAPILGQDPVPPEVLSQQQVIDVKYWNYLDNLEHVGKLVVNQEIVDTMHGFFELAHQIHFPFGPAIPAADTAFVGLDEDDRQFAGLQGIDSRLMRHSITSGFNYRTIAGTDRVSKHGLGLAVDVVQRFNSYDRYDAQGNLVTRQPDNAIDDPNHPCTLTPWHDLVQYMLRRDMIWGGLWDGPVKDKHHFGFKEY